MPPKVKITKQDIINTSIELVRKNGAEAINARAIAASLNCSTQPVFSNFSSMEELHHETMLGAYGIYLDFINSEIESKKYPQYKAFGMAYIRFAEQEKELFKLLFMCDRDGKEIIPSPDFDEAIEVIISATGLSREKATLLHLEMWTFVHGIGTMLATSYLLLDWELISNMLTDVYQGIREKHLSKEKENVSN